MKMNGEEEENLEKKESEVSEEKEVPMGTGVLEEKKPVETNVCEPEEEEFDFADLLRRFTPSTWIILGMIVVLLILAWAFGYSNGYGDCLVMCNEKVANCTLPYL